MILFARIYAHFKIARSELAKSVERERVATDRLAECESKLRDAIADRDAIDRVRDSERYELECLRLDRSGQDYFERHTDGKRWSEISSESRREWTMKATGLCGYGVGQAMYDIDIMYPRGSGSFGASGLRFGLDPAKGPDATGIIELSPDPTAVARDYEAAGQAEYLAAEDRYRVSGPGSLLTLHWPLLTDDQRREWCEAAARRTNPAARKGSPS